MTLKNRIKKLEEIARKNEPPHFITAFSTEEAEQKVKEYWQNNPYGREPEVTVYENIEALHRDIEKNIADLIRANPGLTEAQLVKDFLESREAQQCF